MSYRVGTTHYNLPQTEGTDKRDWSDTNQAFADLDAAVYEAGSDAGLALSAAQTAQTSADGAVADAASAVTTANAASASATAASEAAALARTEAQSAVTTAGQANTTAQAAQATASNADTVALAAQAGVSALETNLTADNNQPFKFAYDNTSQKYGYMVESGGADTFVPFSAGGGYKFIGGLLYTPFTSSGGSYTNNGTAVLAFDFENTTFTVINNGSINNDYISINGGTVTAKVACTRLNADGTTTPVAANTVVTKNWLDQVPVSASYILAFE